MIVRDYKGKLVYFNKNDFSSEYNMYLALWKIMYNINLKEKESISNKIISNFMIN